MALWGVPIISAGAYRGIRRQVVIAFKERARRGLAHQLVSKAVIAEITTLLGEHSRAVIVPVPSTAASFWRRGYFPTLVLAQAISLRINRRPVVPALSVTSHLVGGATDTRQHSRAARLRRRGARIRVSGLAPGLPVVLVDDVMVTGGTLEASARALVRTGHSVIAVVVVAHSPQNHQRPVAMPLAQD